MSLLSCRGLHGGIGDDNLTFRFGFQCNGLWSGKDGFVKLRHKGSALRKGVGYLDHTRARLTGLAVKLHTLLTRWPSNTVTLNRHRHRSRAVKADRDTVAESTHCPGWGVAKLTDTLRVRTHKAGLRGDRNMCLILVTTHLTWAN